jgi:hypothetical protein
MSEMKLVITDFDQIDANDFLKSDDIVAWVNDAALFRKVVDVANDRLTEIEAATRADERRKILEGAPVVYATDGAKPPLAQWFKGPVHASYATHTARLVDIKPIGDEK